MSRRGRSFDRPRFLWIPLVGVLLFLYIPVVVVWLFSFNSGRTLYEFQGFSLRWYEELFSNGPLMSSLWLSLWVALLVSLLSVVLGTGIAFGIRRGARVLGVSLNGMVTMRVIAPETATAVAILLMFTQLGIRLSEITLILAHAVLSVAFASVIILSRLSRLNEEVEESAMDLGASRVGAIWHVALPALRPAIVAAGLLSFVLSFDNFITSFFSAGIGATPLPVRIYSMLRMGVTPVVNAAGVVMLIVTVTAIVTAFVIARALGRRNQALTPQSTNERAQE